MVVGGREASLLRTGAVVRTRDSAELAARRVASSTQSALEREKAFGLSTGRRGASRAEIGDALLDLDLHRLHVEQKCLARLVLSERDRESGIAAHLERSASSCRRRR